MPLKHTPAAGGIYSQDTVCFVFGMTVANPAILGDPQ